ncbi:MAG: hypothetical protein GZ094_06245 [Mariniphaga sp.]|nr:hypothetical protein [Mariniphaga sp.]
MKTYLAVIFGMLMFCIINCQANALWISSGKDGFSFEFRGIEIIQHVDSLYSKMTVSIFSKTTEPDKNGVVHVTNEETTEYSTDMVMKVGLPLSEIDNPERYEGHWDNLFVLAGDSYYLKYDNSKSQEPVFKRISPLKVHSVNSAYGYRKCSNSTDPGPGEWGLIGYSECADILKTQHAMVSLRPYFDDKLASLTSNKPINYVMKVRGPTVIAEMIKQSEVYSIRNQIWNTVSCKMEEKSPGAFTMLIPVEDPFDPGLDEDEVTPPLVAANIIDNYLLDPKGVLSLNLSGREFRKRTDTKEIYESTTSILLSLSPAPFSKVEVSLAGCSELVVGEQAVVTAKATDEGGSFRFWVEPEGMFTINTTGASAKLLGSSPGRGTLYVEYTSAKGKTTQTSQVAACIKIESYNGGQAIPQIAFYDIDGKKKSGIITVPLTAQPANAAELVTFEPANPGVLTAVGVGSEVTLQGIITGKTTLQATTKCGANTGPAVEVEVVNCDEETIAALQRMRQTAMKHLQEANDELKRIAGSEKFEKAKEEIVGSLGEMIAKSALTIVTSGKAPTQAIQTASDIAEAGAAVSGMMDSGSQKEFYENAIKASVGKLSGAAASALMGIIDVQKAAQKFGDNWSNLRDYQNLVKDALATFEKADKDLQKYIRLQEICKGEKPVPPKKDVPKTEPKPEPIKPKTLTKPTPKTEVPTVEQSQTNVSTPSEPSTDDEIMVDPERPVVPPRQVGLPYEPGDCGCENSKEVAASSAGFSTLASGIQNLGNCVGNFRSSTLTDYQQALQELSALTDSLTTTLKSDATTFLVKAKESKPRLDAIVNRIKVYDKAGNEFLKKMEKCPESMTTGMEILKSVEKITIDMLKTNY